MRSGGGILSDERSLGIPDRAEGHMNTGVVRTPTCCCVFAYLQFLHLGLGVAIAHLVLLASVALRPDHVKLSLSSQFLSFLPLIMGKSAEVVILCYRFSLHTCMDISGTTRSLKRW